jgi:hypothetical protein
MRLEGDMKLTFRILLGSTIALVAATSPAQNTVVPLKQIEREARDPVLSARAALPAILVTSSTPGSVASEPSTSVEFVQPPPAFKEPRTLSGSFFLLNGLHLGMAVLDVELTQHCIANHHCSEGNPLMPSSQAGQLSVNVALVSYGTFLSYKLKKRESKLWFLSPAVGIAAHTLGAATGIRNR